mmetsp:Transcript_47684/g.74417  ORF Transcript_47684/g.74417 Transcript_47684/m.74417 type:complete len:172 (+) Transcript_47684:448-963(+)
MDAMSEDVLLKSHGSVEKESLIQGSHTSEDCNLENLHAQGKREITFLWNHVFNQSNPKEQACALLRSLKELRQRFGNPHAIQVGTSIAAAMSGQKQVPDLANPSTKQKARSQKSEKRKSAALTPAQHMFLSVGIQGGQNPSTYGALSSPSVSSATTTDQDNRLPKLPRAHN